MVRQRDARGDSRGTSAKGISGHRGVATTIGAAEFREERVAGDLVRVAWLGFRMHAEKEIVLELVVFAFAELVDGTRALVVENVVYPAHAVGPALPRLVINQP